MPPFVAIASFVSLCISVLLVLLANSLPFEFSWYREAVALLVMPLSVLFVFVGCFLLFRRV